MNTQEELEARKKVIRAAIKRGVATLKLAEEYEMTRASMWQFIRRWNLDEGLRELGGEYNFSRKKLLPESKHTETTKRLAKLYEVEL